MRRVSQVSASTDPMSTAETHRGPELSIHISRISFQAPEQLLDRLKSVEVSLAHIQAASSFPTARGRRPTQARECETHRLRVLLFFFDGTLVFEVGFSQEKRKSERSRRRPGARARADKGRRRRRGTLQGSDLHRLQATTRIDDNDIRYRLVSMPSI
jgi:hypothetical protein